MRMYIVKNDKKRAKREIALLTGGIRESLTYIGIPMNKKFKQKSLKK